MVVLNKIYTRTGDTGQTALGNGQRVAKSSLRISAYGTIDETNAAVGLAAAELGEACAPLPEMLRRIQNDLFDVGADLCVPEPKTEPGTASTRSVLRVSDDQVTRLEREIDTLNESLSPLRSFVLPGGSLAAAQLHMARTICRRAERILWQLVDDHDEPLNSAVLKFVNRLSDFLFVASRYVNHHGSGDVLWVPGQNR
jgi:cob(I)alamin adenosyltransferase